MKLGQGVDVTWAEFTTYIDLYDEQLLKDFKAAGFENMRVRVGEQNQDEAFMIMLKTRLRQCIDNGIIPILAYHGHYIEEDAPTDAAARDHLVNWWGNMAEELKDFPDSLTFKIERTPKTQ
jgi:hypothetical protein